MIFVFLTLYLAAYYTPESTLYGILVECVIISLVLSNFWKTDYNKSIEKAGWFCACIYTILNIIFFTWIDESFCFSWEVALLEAVGFIGIFLYSKYRTYDIPSDEYNSFDTFIILKRPRNFIDYLLSFFFVPVSSLSVVSAGYRYGFRKGQPFSRREYIEKNYHRYIKVKVADFTVEAKFSPLLGRKWKMSENCCHMIQKLFPWHTFKKLDALPSHMTKTIFKIRGMNNA